MAAIPSAGADIIEQNDSDMFDFQGSDKGIPDSQSKVADEEHAVLGQHNARQNTKSSILFS